jgi:hypothetical protein
VIVRAHLFHRRKAKLTTAEQKDALYWLLVASAKGRYSRGSSETVLDTDLSTLSKGGSAADLIELLRLQFGRLDFEPADIALRSTRSPIFPLVFLALRACGAQDWFTGLGISLTHQGKLHYIQSHHIFPKARLRELYDRREINEIANMAFIGGGTNRAISSKPPAEYLADVVANRGTVALEQQAVPVDPDLHRVENYRRFLEHRRAALADAVNAFLASKQ